MERNGKNAIGIFLNRRGESFSSLSGFSGEFQWRGTGTFRCTLCYWERWSLCDAGWRCLPLSKISHPDWKSVGNSLDSDMERFRDIGEVKKERESERKMRKGEYQGLSGLPPFGP